jgi:hypothetical protein
MNILGTPQKSEWSEGYKLASQMGVVFPKHPKQDLKKIIPGACEEAYDLLEQMLQYDSTNRPTA